MGRKVSRLSCALLTLALCFSAAFYTFAAKEFLTDNIPTATAQESLQASTIESESVRQDQAEKRIVRVAFPQVPGLSMKDAQGVRSGVYYDWLMEIAKYAGWTYDFVDGDLADLLVRVQTGDIHLAGNMYQRLQYEETLDYSQFSMGANRLLLISYKDNESIARFDLSTLNGKKIGVFKNATDKIRRLENFLDFNAIECTVVPLDRNAYDRCLEEGSVDVMLTSDIGIKEGCKVVAEFSGEPQYFAVTKGSDLQPQLNDAMQRIYEADSNFAQTLYDTYFPEEHIDPIGLNAIDRAFVDQAPEIRVALMDDQYPLVYQNEGILQGVAKDLFSNIAQRTGLTFRFVYASTYADTLALVQSGEADIAGSFMDDERNAAYHQMFLTKSYLSLDETTFKNKSSAGVSEGLVVAQIAERSGEAPEINSTVVFYDTYEQCLEAVNSGVADSVSMPSSFAEKLFSEKSYTNVAPATSARRDVTCSIALPKRANADLYAVLSKAVHSFSDEEIDGIVAKNTIPVSSRTLSLESIIADNPLAAVCIALAFILLVGMVGVTVVVSKLRARIMENKLEKAEETGRAKSDFLSRMSHEIRTPMNAIIGLSNVASLSGEATPAIRVSLEKINASAQFLLALVNDVLDMAKIDNGKMQITLAPLRLSDLSSQLESMFSFQAEAKKIHFLVNCDAETVVVGDDVRLQQVLANLLSNAFKFTEVGGMVSLSIDELGCSDKHMVVRFGVKDDGAGLREEDKDRVFAAFEQAATSHRNAQGTGLGLAISSNLVRLMGGTIEVESDLGKGSEFYFILNLAQADEADVAESLPVFSSSVQQEGEARTGSLEGRRVLLAEDNELNAEIAIALLEMEGAKIDLASNGHEAVVLFAASDVYYYDFVLMDVKMPVLDGFAATAQIRALDRVDAREIPVIALTANTFQEDRDNAAAVGMSAFVPKPFDAKLLYDTLLKFSPSSTGDILPPEKSEKTNKA